jgi:hypothetical protein
MWRILAVSSLLIICISMSAAFAEAKEPFEDMHLKMGYKTVEDAVAECEKYAGRDIKLPIELPPVAFTHHLGRCTSTYGNVANAELEIEYLNERESTNHFMIRISPSKHKANFFRNKRNVIRTYKLSDGSEADYGTYPLGHFNFLSFDKNEWHYVLSASNRSKDNIPAEVLVNIADSVRLSYPDPKENPLR